MRGTGPETPVLNNDDPALFPKLTDEQIELLRRHGHVQPIEVGDILFREGDATYDPMVLLEGTVEVVIGARDRARNLAIQRPRDLMVEFNILTGQGVGATGIVREAGSILVCAGKRVSRSARSRTGFWRFRASDPPAPAQGS